MSASMKAKIAALRAKTAAAGCTEAEALAAAELAARLMRDHGLSEVDLVMTEAETPDPTTRATWRSTLSSVIAHVTNTASIVLQNARNGSMVQYIGIAPGPEIAVYLRDLTFRGCSSRGKGLQGRRLLSPPAHAEDQAASVGRLHRRSCPSALPSADRTLRADSEPDGEGRGHRRPRCAVPVRPGSTGTETSSPVLRGDECWLARGRRHSPQPRSGYGSAAPARPVRRSIAMAAITPPDGSAWTLEPVATATGVALVLTIPKMSASTIQIAISRTEARAFAHGILAAAGDAAERTFPHPTVLESTDG